MSEYVPEHPELSVIVPCYNEQDVLPVFYKQLKSVLDQLSLSYEILLVNDGSADRTMEILMDLSAHDSSVFYISLSRNFGKESAMYAGLCNCRGTYIALMDADLQDPPGMLPEMLEKVRSGKYDCAAAKRTDRSGEPKLRSFLSSSFYHCINRMSDTHIEEGARDFRVMTADMANAVVRMSEYNRFSKGIFSWVGFRTCWIPYSNQKRAAGKTKWSLSSLFHYAFGGIVSFSQAPLALVSGLGMVMAGFSFTSLIFIILRKLICGDPVAGWASTICVIIFIGGLQLFCLGIISQYISQIYLETKHRPHYIADKSNIKDYHSMM